MTRRRSTPTRTKTNPDTSASETPTRTKTNPDTSASETPTRTKTNPDTSASETPPTLGGPVDRDVLSLVTLDGAAKGVDDDDLDAAGRSGNLLAELMEHDGSSEAVDCMVGNLSLEDPEAGELRRALQHVSVERLDSIGYFGGALCEDVVHVTLVHAGERGLVVLDARSASGEASVLGSVALPTGEVTPQVVRAALRVFAENYEGELPRGWLKGARG